MRVSSGAMLYGTFRGCGCAPRPSCTLAPPASAPSGHRSCAPHIPLNLICQPVPAPTRASHRASPRRAMPTFTESRRHCRRVDKTRWGPDTRTTERRPKALPQTRQPPPLRELARRRVFSPGGGGEPALAAAAPPSPSIAPSSVRQSSSAPGGGLAAKPMRSAAPPRRPGAPQEGGPAEAVPCKREGEGGRRHPPHASRCRGPQGRLNPRRPRPPRRSPRA